MTKRTGLSAKSQTGDDGLVAFGIFSLEVFKELSALIDFFDQSSPRMVIVGMNFEVTCEILDMRG